MGMAMGLMISPWVGPDTHRCLLSFNRQGLLLSRKDLSRKQLHVRSLLLLHTLVEARA